jgi:hypothetical protein
MRRKNRFLAIFCASILSASIAGASAKSESKQTETLLSPLVGQKCTVVLQDNDTRVGTLWDFGGDFIILKVKKGLLYSKAEKFKLADVKYLEDEKGKRIDISTLLLQRKPEPEKEQSAEHTEKPPVTLYIGSSRSERDVTEPKNNIEPALVIRTRPATASPKTFPKQAELTKDPHPGYSGTNQEQETRTEIEAVHEKARVAMSTTPAKIAKAGSIKEPSRNQPGTKRSETKVAEPPADVHPTNPPVTIQVVNPSSEFKTIKYQHAIFFGVILFIFTSILFFNLAGLRGKVIDKQHLFPVKLIKIEGKYGVIDQGTNEGVRVNDIVRFHSRLGRQIQYKGKVSVKKVNRTFAAVEVMTKKKHFDLEVGDAGVRDRNVIGNAFEKSRAAMSVILSGIAKVLAFTSRTIEIKREEPDIDLDRVTSVQEDELLDRAETHSHRIVGRAQARISDGSSSRNAPAQTKDS